VTSGQEKRWSAERFLSWHLGHSGGKRLFKRYEWVEWVWPIRKRAIFISSYIYFFYEKWPGKRFFFNFEELLLFFWFFQDRDRFLKMSLLDNWIKLEAGGRMLREILGNLVAFLAALSTASFPFIPICAGTHMKVREMLHVLRMWRERRIRCTKG